MEERNRFLLTGNQPLEVGEVYGLRIWFVNIL
jgi:hypothetical protein